jgi:hypothetical protein
LQEYSDLVKRELLSERQQVNFLTADGVKFAHPLHHLGKSKEDLPLIAVDSFRNGCVERGPSLNKSFGIVWSLCCGSMTFWCGSGSGSGFADPCL